MRIVLASPATPLLPISILLLPVVRLSTGQSAQCDVAYAGCVVIERTNTRGRVVVADCVAKERTNTI